MKLLEKKHCRVLRGDRSAIYLIFALSFLLYSSSFLNGWTLDDYAVVIDNPDIRSLPAFFVDTFPGRPLREFSFLLDYTLFGLKPAGWHFQNIFWHGLNSSLLFVLLRRLQVKEGVAWSAVLLFLVHPLQVEVVANIANRKDSLSLAFVLLALLAYSEVFRAERKKLVWLAVACLLGGLAWLAKQNAIVLPLVFAAYEVACVPPPSRLLLRRPKVVAMTVVLVLASGLVWYLGPGRQLQLRLMPAVMAKMNAPFSGETVVPYFQLMLKSWAFMFSRLVFPFDLGPEYVFSVPRGWSDPWVFAALAGVGGYLAALMLAVRRRPLVFFALAWMGLFWLPTSNLWPLSYFAADRYLYAPSVGFCVLAALFFGGVRPVPAAVRTLLTGGVLLFLAGLTWQQNGVWRSNQTLWAQAVRVNPQSTTALNNLAMVYMQQKEWAQALELLQRAAANFNDPMPYYNLGQVHESMGDLEKAVASYRSFLAFNDPTYRALAGQLRQRLYRRYGIVLR